MMPVWWTSDHTIGLVVFGGGAVVFAGIMVLLALFPDDCADPRPTGQTRNWVVSVKPITQQLQAEVVCRDGHTTWKRLG